MKFFNCSFRSAIHIVRIETLIFMKMWYSFLAACTVSFDKQPTVPFCDVFKSLIKTSVL